MKNLIGLVVAAALSFTCIQGDVAHGATIERIKSDLRAAPNDPAKWDALKVAVPGYLKKNPGDTAATAILGIVKLHFGDLKEAKKLIKKASLKNPGNQFAIAGLSNIAMKDKNWQGVIDTVKPALAKSPNNEDFHAYLATAYAKQGNTFKSEFHYDRLFDINPSYKGIPVSSYAEFMQFVRDVKLVVDTVTPIINLIKLLLIVFL